MAAKDRCECTLGPLKVEAPSIWGPGGRLDPLSGKGQCSRRATTTARGLCVCAQHARILGPSSTPKPHAKHTATAIAEAALKSVAAFDATQAARPTREPR